jgi:hypothetical protein
VWSRACGGVRGIGDMDVLLCCCCPVLDCDAAGTPTPHAVQGV